MDQAVRNRLRLLELRALRLVSGRFLGEWSSNVRGQGLEFRDLREYVPGDDVRRLDWKATARSGRPQLRRFSEDRQQSVWIAVDLSASMRGAKAAMANEIAAVLGWAAMKQGDRFGFAAFSDRVEAHRPPARGELQLQAALEEILSLEPESPRTSFAPLWEFFHKRLGQRSTIVVVSDFEASLEDRFLKALCARHEVICLEVTDGSGAAPAKPALALFEDGESGERLWLEAGGAKLAAKAAEAAASGRAAKALAIRKTGAWHATLPAGKDFLPALMDFFHRRGVVLGA